MIAMIDMVEQAGHLNAIKNLRYYNLNKKLKQIQICNLIKSHNYSKKLLRS